MRERFVRRGLVAGWVLLALFVAVLPAQARGGLWPQDNSDLRADPEIVFGVLPNGLRYAIKPNSNPEGTVTLKLRVAAGSLHETDAERGVAHFLEHMAFNGSKNYPEGEMFKALQRMGMQIGANANAATDFDNTTFLLSLPSVRAQTLDTGFNILREIADRLTLSSEAIGRERGVILSEERSRDTPNQQASTAQLKLLFAGQKYPDRAPIGDTAFIRNATLAQLRSFYERYYRPERSLLVVVGDVDPKTMAAKIATVFGTWSQPGPPPAPVDFGKPKPRGLEAAHVVQPGLEENVAINWVIAEETRPDSKVRRREVHDRLIAFTVLNRRLTKVSRQENPPFIDARIDREQVGGAGIVTSLSVRTRAGQWARGLAAAEQELRRALRHGLQQSEVTREALEQRSPYLLFEANSKTQSNADVADLVLASIDANRVPTDPKTDLDLYTASTKDMKAARVTAALKAAVSGAGPLIFLTSDQELSGGDAAIRTAYVNSTKVPVQAAPESAIKAFSYRDFGPKGAIAERKTVSDLDATLVRFQNGVRGNVKSTSFEKDKVSVIVRFPGGYMALPKAKRGIAWALPFAFVEGGLGKLDIQELEQTEPGHFAGISLDVDEAAFQLSGETVQRDVLLQLQVLAAFFTDPAYRPDGLRRIQAAGEGQIGQEKSSPMGVLARALPALVRNDDDRWAAPSLEDMRALTMDDVKAAIAPSLAGAPIEVTVVGNVKVDDAIDAIAKTFGAFAPRPSAFQLPQTADGVQFPSKAREVDLRHAGRADQAAVAAAWPGPDRFGDTRRERVVEVLNEVVQLRLLDEVREAQGGTYTPFGNAYSSPALPGFGYIFAGVEPKPDQVDLFFTTLDKIVQELQDGQLSDDLLERARKPLLYQHYAAESTNSYWLEALQEIQLEPRNLKRVQSAMEDYGTITAVEVIDAAKAYLSDRRRIDIRVLPK